MWEDLCECVSNAQIGRSILDMLRRYTRQYCNDVECPVDGTPQGAPTTNPQVVLFTAIIGLMVLGITMQLVNRRRRQNQLPPTKPARQADGGCDDQDRSGPRDPPPAVM